MRFGSNELDNTDDKKKIVRSFQIGSKLWNEFDQLVENEFGQYKKSLVIEHLIRKFMIEKCKKEEEGKDRSWI